MFFFISCSSIPDTKVLQIDLSKIIELETKNAFTDIELIPLELTNSSGFNRVCKVIPHNNNYFVLDPRINELKVFDSSGLFLRNISNNGDAPNSIDLISDFNYNTHTDEWELLSPQGKDCSLQLW